MIQQVQIACFWFIINESLSFDYIHDIPTGSFTTKTESSWTYEDNEKFYLFGLIRQKKNEQSTNRTVRIYLFKRPIPSNIHAKY